MLHRYLVSHFFWERLPEDFLVSGNPFFLNFPGSSLSVPLQVTFTNCQNVEFLEGNPCSFVLAPGETMSKSLLRQKEPGPSKYNLRVHCKGAYTGEEDAKESGGTFHFFSFSLIFWACHRATSPVASGATHLAGCHHPMIG